MAIKKQKLTSVEKVALQMIMERDGDIRVMEKIFGKLRVFDSSKIIVLLLENYPYLKEEILGAGR